ncbi:GTPase, partial [Staphylococcus sp. SIMBA_130]
IRNRITDLKRQLDNTVKHRDQYRARRKRNETLQVALVGYTNAGKSTIFNRLTKADSYEEDKLFATLDPMTRQLKLPNGYNVLLT